MPDHRPRNRQLERAAELGIRHSDRDVKALARDSLEIEADAAGVDLTDALQWAAYVTAWATAYLSNEDHAAVLSAAGEAFCAVCPPDKE